jgi:hypothetical protein
LRKHLSTPPLKRPVASPVKGLHTQKVEDEGRLEARPSGVDVPLRDQVGGEGGERGAPLLHTGLTPPSTPSPSKNPTKKQKQDLTSSMEKLKLSAREEGLTGRQGGEEGGREEAEGNTMARRSMLSAFQ